MNRAWDPSYLKRLDYRSIFIIFSLMGISLLILLSTTSRGQEALFSPIVKNQIRSFLLGIFFYMVCACFNYQKIREWTWFLYVGMVLLLIGLFFTDPIHNVRRWYRFYLFPFDVQPSECAKLIVIIALSWFLEKNIENIATWKTFFKASLIVAIPFLLILKEPDLGTSLILCPIALAIFYFSGIKKSVVYGLTWISTALFCFILSIFLGLLSHEQMKPFFTKVLKEYQYERLNPKTYHQTASQTAIALGKFWGTGLFKSEFTGQKWLPYAYTDSTFSAFAEEFGLLGALLLLALFFFLIYLCIQVSMIAKDLFGKFLCLGISIYLTMHVLINVGMMCGCFPITGVPLVLISYGGSSVLSTMIALGLVQSVYVRRFSFA